MPASGKMKCHFWRMYNYNNNNYYYNYIDIHRSYALSRGGGHTLVNQFLMCNYILYCI